MDSKIMSPKSTVICFGLSVLKDMDKWQHNNKTTTKQQSINSLRPSNPYVRQ